MAATMWLVCGFRSTRLFNAFNRGESPESILLDFPALERLSNVYGAIAFYLDNRARSDQYLAESERDFEPKGIALKDIHPERWERFQLEQAALAGSRI